MEQAITEILEIVGFIFGGMILCVWICKLMGERDEGK